MMTLQERMENFEPDYDVSPCDSCARRTGPNTCEAFPKGIPEVFEAGYNDHRKPYFGDGGKQYVRRPDADIR